MKLKIFEQNEHLENLTPFEIMATDITILNGVIKGEPIYKKGRKVSSGYFLDKEQTNMAIQKIFEDEIDSKGFLVGLNVYLKWFDIYENPVLTKEIYVPFSISESAETSSKRRKRAVNYLQEAGIRLGVKKHIDKLFDYYSNYQESVVSKNLINSYIENNSKELQVAITKEKTPGIKKILSHKLPNKTTVKDSFLYQIT